MSATHLPRAMPLTHTLRAFNHPRIQQQLIRRAPRLIRNYASQPADTSNLRPLVLEKPDKFRPPSHPSRKPGPRRSFGPRLTNEEMEAQKTKEYPHMMPPEGSFKHKLLTSRGFHVWLSMSVLVTLALSTLYMDFHSRNKYPDLVPHSSLFFSHPFQYISQYMQVYRMHKQAETAENMAKKQRKQDEVRKRREYMRAHGIEHEGPYGMGTVEGDEYRAKMEEERAQWSIEEKAREEVAAELRERRRAEAEVSDGEEVRGFDGERRKVKKWFGIW